MKKHILLFTIFTVVFFNQLLAQEHYYYYNGGKIFLELVTDKASIIFSKGNSTETIRSTYILENNVRTISDNIYDIKAVHLKDAKNEKSIELLKSDMQNTNKDVIVLPAYKNAQFDELIMTNYLNIRLKTDKDIDKLYLMA